MSLVDQEFVVVFSIFAEHVLVVEGRLPNVIPCTRSWKLAKGHCRKLKEIKLYPASKNYCASAGSICQLIIKR